LLPDVANRADLSEFITTNKAESCNVEQARLYRESNHIESHTHISPRPEEDTSERQGALASIGRFFTNMGASAYEFTDRATFPDEYDEDGTPFSYGKKYSKRKHRGRYSHVKSHKHNRKSRKHNRKSKK